MWPTQPNSWKKSFKKLFHKRYGRNQRISNSDSGRIQYEVAVNFFPHNDAEDFAVSYDAYFNKTLYDAAGRRSKKREAQLLEQLRDEADTLAATAGGVIFWDQPIGPERRG